MRFRVSLISSLALAAAAAAQAADWPQFNLNPQHSGASDQEVTIRTTNVATLHLAYPAVTLPAIADGAPAFLQGVSTSTGVKDLLFLTTKDGRVLAIDAATGTTVWSKQPATTPAYTTSSPAINPGRQYVYSYALDGKVHKYQVGDGTEITTGGWPELATRKPDVEKGSSALAIATVNGTSYLYVANGGYPGDAGDYQGHVTAINLTTGTQNVFNADCSNLACHLYKNGSGDCGHPQPDCSHVQSAIWARAGVVYDPGTNKLFMATGNGDFDANTGGDDWGDSVFALNPDGTGNGTGWPLDSYTPTEYQTLQNNDTDLGSTAPAILPVPPGSTIAHLAVQSGKDSELRLINLDNLSGAGGPGHTGGELQKISVPQGGDVFTAIAVWVNPADHATWIFVTTGAGISGLKLGLDGTGKPQLLTASPNAWTNPTGGSSPIVVNGILFYASSGGMLALDPTTGTQLWHDTNLGPIHWESPIVVNGYLFVTDENAHLLAYKPNALKFSGVIPCRLVDTRHGPRDVKEPGGVTPAGFPRGTYADGEIRTYDFTASTSCPGLPQHVGAWSLLFQFTTATQASYLQAWPYVSSLGIGGQIPIAGESTLLGYTDRWTANSAIIPGGDDANGSINVLAQHAGDVIVEVNGYFK
ncbi:MAG: PQQ-binding-like beta-propeller repeat protein [Thermoanaerobaculales bacterium]